jgi:acetylornithine deacetylase
VANDRTGAPAAEYALGLLERLVRTPSVNPALAAGPHAATRAGETAVARLVEAELRALGCDVDWREPRPGRPSVVGRLRGAGAGPSLMLNGHLDTVGVAGMPEPFAARHEDGRLYGRGACDMKGGIAAMLAAARALAGSPVALAGDLLVAAVADEETESLGTLDVLGHYRPDAAIVTEPTGLAPCIAHKGFVWLEVTVPGRAAHGSRPDLGIDANVRLGELLSGVGALARDLGRRPPHPLLGTASVHAGRVRGGTGESTYAATASAVLERRTLPGEGAADAEAEVNAILSTSEWGRDARVRVLLDRAPFETGVDAPIVGALRAVLVARGHDAACVGQPPWMDAALLAAAGVDTVVIGPAGEGAHAAVEWVDTASVVELAEVLAATARSYCGTVGP